MLGFSKLTLQNHSEKPEKSKELPSNHLKHWWYDFWITNLIWHFSGAFVSLSNKLCNPRACSDPTVSSVHRDSHSENARFPGRWRTGAESDLLRVFQLKQFVSPLPLLSRPRHMRRQLTTKWHPNNCWLGRRKFKSLEERGYFPRKSYGKSCSRPPTVANWKPG